MQAAVISVEDSGAGLPAEKWQLAIEPFRALQPIPPTVHSGLGLATVLRLVDAAGGSLDVERAEGRFCVTVTLPAARAATRSVERNPCSALHSPP
jgi:signal transduction histidine kinase